MYEYLKGMLVEKNTSSVVLEVCNIGYRLLVPLTTFHALPAIGSVLTLYAAWIIREHAHALYGFITQEQKECFEMLLTLSGIGPKTALAILGHLELTELQQAVEQENSSKLTQVPGIGKKTAAKLMVDLKDRFKLTFATMHITEGQAHMTDALKALIHLGYSHALAEKALKRALLSLPPQSGLSTLITAALKHIN